ncbi:MAG: IPExxxVDY family protein [Cyclobacteriaceae bacterium]|nr:IPExxxVDY family protein [Cytophagales bacterium]MBX2899936.1 IPExxxVDY family protein [Cyclobacteriaceae bacterium]
MAKLKKKRLDVEYTFDFELTGIISTAKGYKLAWELNQAAGLRLVRQPDLVVQLKERVWATFAQFVVENEVNVLKLFRNKPQEAELLRERLVPEFGHYDYILYSKGEAHMSSKRLQELLKNIPSIELAAFIPLAALKSKENFIF